MTATGQPAATPAAIQPSLILKAKIEALRRRKLQVAVLTGAAMALVIGLELLALAMFLDWWLDLPWGVRLVSLLAQLGVGAYFLVRYVVRPLFHQPDEDELALLVEKSRPELRSRLIASLQLTRPGAVPPGASVVLVDALVEETEAVAAPMDFAAIVPTDKLRKFGLMAIIIPVLALAAFFAGGQATTDLLKRVVLLNVPVPRKTRVLVAEGHKRIGLGDSVRLEATAQGIIPSTGKLRVEFRSGRVQEFALEQDRTNRVRFGRTIENVQDSFNYRIYLNDGVSSTFTVKAVPRPTVATIACEQEYPAYTKLKPTKRALGDLSLLAGSRLKLAVAATKPIQSASLKLVNATNNAATLARTNRVALRVNAQNPKELAGELPIPARDLTGFQVELVDSEGMASSDTAVYRVEIIPDKVPVVRLTYPDRKEELITRYATLLVAFDAVDDFQISKARIRYKVDSAEQGAEQVVDLDLAGEEPQRLRRRFEWKIGDLKPMLTEGSAIEYWIEAEDNNNATGPGVGSSDHQIARIVTEAEKRADLWSRAGDYMGSIEDVTGDQERLNRTLGALILEKTGPRR